MKTSSVSGKFSEEEATEKNFGRRFIASLMVAAMYEKTTTALKQPRRPAFSQSQRYGYKRNEPGDEDGNARAKEENGYAG
ncbi:hypothetical protein T4D_728 [Trichinella pseudospiralis]|uniref:Uncharacterized protein n=1 Tax=Trichinella pseudospiralis TaxID=6337 RepID=A0A0V1F5P3_TRIPS|nr:hypothetical protein T4D_728 [Trichinella pseudospiralis]